MKINLKYDVKDKVYITALERYGIIISIWITFKGTKFEVRYFDNAVAKEVYFYEEELEKK